MARYFPMLLACATVLSSEMAGGEPYLPASDATVLGNVRSAADSLIPGRGGSMAEQLADARKDKARALELAASLASAAEETGDDRLSGYAESLVEPWAESHDERALLLRATLRQKNHRFDQSLSDLNLLLSLRPDDQQALLMRASVLQVGGRFAEAESDCTKINSTVIANVCAEVSRGMAGDVAASYERLGLFLEKNPIKGRRLAAWTLGILADMSLRSGDVSQAEGHFKAVLSIAPNDTYALAGLADLLLGSGRNAETVSLLMPHAALDPMLVRIGIAQMRMKDPAGEHTTKKLLASFQAARERQMAVHEREEAMFVLDVLGDAEQAYSLAESNWKKQKERIDILLLARAAEAAGRKEALAELAVWIHSIGYTDKNLASLVNAH